MVPKPSNPEELRLVIDYRQINEITVKDKYPLPDVPMNSEDVEKTAMNITFGAYEWLVMPMGLSNSPSCWQRMTEQYLGHLPFCRVFVDDFMLFASIPEAHLDAIRQTLEACRKNKMYLKESKLKCFKISCRFLGHCVTREGCRPQQDKVAA
eukprot:gene4862-biopygen4808